MSIFKIFRHEPTINANDDVLNEPNAITNGRDVRRNGINGTNGTNAIIDDGNDESKYEGLK